jgi:hypothetical protein
MPCACKVNRDISYLQKRYGVKTQQSKESHIREKARIFLEKLGLSLLILPLIPILFIWIIIRVIVNKEPIKISKLFGLQHVRQ